MMKIGLFYGSSTNNTEYIAFDIRDMVDAQLGAESVELHNVGRAELGEMLAYDHLILGIPTWDIGELQADWDIVWSDLGTLNLSGKKIAIFGLGDQYGYPDTFLDAAGILAETVLELGGELVGYTAIEGYEFEASLFLDGDRFMGLALDEDRQSDQTRDRLETWVQQILSEFALTPEAVAA